MSRPHAPLTIAGAAADDVPAVVDPLFREYGEWVADELRRHAGIVFTAADQARHHEAFRSELDRLLRARGRLLVARLGDEPVGVGALKPIDDATAEIKRMFVRPASRGHGIGRALLERLVEDARRERYATVRLETLRFMTVARAIYRSFGFVEVARFPGSETVGTPLDPLTVAMEFSISTLPDVTEPMQPTDEET